jgi:hypothetical protein
VGPAAFEGANWLVNCQQGVDGLIARYNTLRRVSDWFLLGALKKCRKMESVKVQELELLFSLGSTG